LEVHYRYEPAGPVSGDYCDVVLPDGDHAPLFFALGDISGKGVAASMVMANLQAIFRSLLATGEPLQALVERANRVFCESTLPTHYATLVCGQASADGEVELCNAGHCPPVLRRGGEMETIAATGLPVGLFSSGSFLVRTVWLRPGDVLLLYTDGLSEALDASGAEYGDERPRTVLARCGGLSASDVVRACVDDLRAFEAGAGRRDDLTVMALRRA
jgi:sigma-B regulation protein RsbU (phosphoserine phosphatase)